nr:zinc-binding dehydrogenase [Bradyrhizobium sp. 170]
MRSGFPVPSVVMAPSWAVPARSTLPKSIKIGYPTFFDHIHTPKLLRARSARLFDWIREGKLKIRIGGEYPLADAAKAHADMESRATTGKLLLIP